MKFKSFLIELDPKLAYHSELNPKIWKKESEQYVLDSKVKEHLMKIAYQFAESLNLEGSVVSDYVFTGSNANYNWTDLSDIDVHLILDQERLSNCEACKSELEDCLQAKKTLWNDRHDIQIYGHDVEVYVTTVGEKTILDSGTYSLLEDRWLKVPEKKNIDLDTESVRVKAESIAGEIDQIIDSRTDDKKDIQELIDRIWKMRAAGLEKNGEFSTENLTFKALRNNGYLDKIKHYFSKAQDDELSLK